MSDSRIRIGTYGAHGAGKTRFFRQLVKDNALPVPPGSRLADFLAAATAADGSVVPTTTAFESIDIKIGKTSFVVSDNKGDILSEAVGRLESEHRRGSWSNPIARQTATSDALLFFFDPTAGATTDRLAKHHAEERLRAKQLIDHVLESRQNLFLPIVFVLMHRDQWTPEQAKLADDWTNQVDAYLTEAYSKKLRKHFPTPLVRKEHIFHAISSAEPEHAKELVGVMEKVRTLVGLVDRFRRRDRRRSLRLVALFLLCLFLILWVPFLCFTSPTVQKALIDFRDKTAPMLNLPIGLSAFDTASEPKIELDPLFNGTGELGEPEARSLNRSLFFLMKKLNKLEDDGKPATDEDRAAVELWNRAAQTIRDRFTKEDSAPDRLDRYGILLNGLTDTPKRQPRILNEVLKDYWAAYRQRLLIELRRELAAHREANTPSMQILSELCVRLEAAFRDASESGVRGDAFSTGGDETRKESLKQDIRKAFIACRNYIDRVPLEVVVVSAAYDSDREIDRDINRRLVFSGGREKGEVFIDLTISTGFQSNTACVFLPSRKEFTLSFVPDGVLNVAVQGKPKGSKGEWDEITDWDLAAQPPTEFSLAALGIPFYRKFENEENTSYALFAEGYKLELIVRRPRNVPELLWEIVDEPNATLKETKGTVN